MADFKLVLASNSPRRKELLKNAGFAFDVIPSDTDEKSTCKNNASLVKDLARGKAMNVANRIKGDNKYKKGEVIVLGSDTIVAFDGEVLGKPKNKKDAEKMLKELSGNKHYVYTGVCLIRLFDGKIIEKTIFNTKTAVYMYPLTASEIKDYIATEEPMDKAGAYAIQGLFAKHVRKIDGDYNTVVGLPIGEVYRAINELRGV